MPPAGGPKRKRSDRNLTGDDAPRASPHRPADLDLAKHSQAVSPTQSRDDGARLTRRQSRTTRNAAPDTHSQSSSTDVPIVKSPTAVHTNSSTSAMNGQSYHPAKSIQSASYSNQMYDYAYLSDEVVQNWSASGREKIISTLIDLSQGEDIALDLLLQELVEAATTNKIDPHDAGLLIKESIAQTSSADSAESSSPIQGALLAAISIIFADEDPKSTTNQNSHVSELATFLQSTDIDTDVIRIEFDAKLMEQLGLIRNTFHKQVIRKQTNVLYRQANYNLLREESEGFSKLVTELFTTSGNEVPTSDVVEGAVERVKAMIGAFDLDVGRSLDVVLDVFGSVLVKQYRFFVKFLRASPWWPRADPTAQDFSQFSRLSGLPLWALPGAKDHHLTQEQKSELAQLTQDRDADFWRRAREQGLRAYFLLGRHRSSDSSPEESLASGLTKEWIAETGTLPHLGSSEAAQLLGFKLRFHAPGAEGDTAEGTPRNLIYLAALLIKIGFISLHDLYPHLWRLDADMDILKQQKQKEKDEREQAARPGAGAKNALASAGALTDDTDPVPPRLREQGTRANTPAKDVEPDKSTVKETVAEKPDQKVMLLQNLLAIGALPEALFILGRFPWMTNLIPELPEYINRILHYSLSKVYESLRPLSSRGSLHQQAPWYETDVPRLSKGQASLGEAPQRRVLRWPLLDREDSETDGTNYRFYWDEWSDNIPICQTYEDVFTLCKTLLPLVGAKIGQDPSLTLKFARIGKASLKQDDSTANKDRWLDLIKRVILPSISLTKANPGAVNEVYDLINLYSTETRYQVYLEWLTGKTSKTPDMLSASRQAMWETSDVLKKISKTNVKPMARALAKIAYSNPHVVIRTAFKQIESYDSIANVFVEGVRYFTDLGYDVLTWSLIEGLAKDTRSGLQEDGLFASKWLTALSRFAGNIYKRYNLMKPGPILQYVSTRLHKGISTELIMLEQLVVSMAGIAPDANYNDTQLLAMGGGQLLQSQTVLQLLDQRHNSKLTAKRLIKALQDYGLTGKFLLMMAQRRYACIFERGDAPLKAVGHTFDEITRILGQYLDFLRTNLSSDEFQKAVPSVGSLLTDYDIPAEVAFWIGRPIVQKQMNDHDKDDSKDIVVKDVNGDVEMNDQDASEEDGEAIEDGDVTTGAATPTENEIMGGADVEITEAEEVNEGKWHPILKGIMDDIQSHVPAEVRDLVGTGFYVSFWQLSLYDISVPGKSYEDEMTRTKKKIASITADRSNVSSSSAKQRESQIKALKQLNEDLLAENKQHLKAYGDSKARLAREKDQWFVAKSRMSAELNTALMEHCFLPRMLLSHLDAYFCFKFAKMLHSLGTANFRTLGFYDLLFKPERLTSLAFMCTSKEADHLGKFLCEVLRDLSRWHKTKATYEREAFGTKKNLPGFALKVENGKPQSLLEFEKFRSLLFKWHTNLFTALAKCLQSPEYMHVRNAISILRSISQVFPVVAVHGKTLQKLVDKLRESDREDLRISSLALLSTLNRRQKEWLPSQAFRQGSKLPQEVAEEEADKKRKLSDVKPRKDLLEDKSGDVKMKDIPAARNDKAETTKEGERTPSSTSNAASHRSPSRTGTPLPARPPRDNNSLRPPRPESRTTDLPRRVSPPPRFTPQTTLPTRPDAEQRDGYRDARPPRPAPSEPPRSDSRTGYPPRHTTDRAQDTSHEPYHRLPRPTDRPSMLDRDERAPRREHEPRAGYEERRYNEREPRAEREPRLERDPRHERDHARTGREYPRSERTERPERTDRDYSRPTPDHPDRSERPERPARRDEAAASSRRDAPTSSRNATPVATAPSINPERAALIQGTEEPRPGMSIRGQAQERNRSSRPTSPRREEDRKHAPRSEREDRQERKPEQQSRNAPPAPATVPPRNPPATGPPRDRGRPPVDMSHGRLEQDGSHRPPTRPERTQDTEPPSGPRPRPSNQPVRTNEPAPPPPRPLPQNRQPPSGPGGPSRHNRTTSYAEQSAGSPGGADTTGIHPDRLNHIAPTSPEQPRGQRPPPVQTAPPSGPRGNHNSAPPTGPAVSSPSTRGPPSGPQAELPGQGNGRGRRHPINSVNNTLAQAAQGPAPPNGRGRGTRQNSISYTNQIPPSPIGGPPTPSFNGPSQQQDLMSNNPNPNGMPVQPRAPSRQDAGRDDDRRPPRGHHSERNERDGPKPYKDDNSNTNRRDHRGPPTQHQSRDQDGQGQGQQSRNGPNQGSGPRYPRGPNPNMNGDDGQGSSQHNSRKHPRDDSGQGQYGGGGGSNRGGRVASDAKRPRRGGGGGGSGGGGGGGSGGGPTG